MQQFIPAVVLAEDIKHLVLRHRVLQHRRVITIRNAQQQAVLERQQVEQRHITRTGQQHVRVVVDILAHAEIAAVRISQGLEDRTLVVIPLSEHTDHLFRLFLLLRDRPVLRDDLQHPLFDSCNDLACHHRRGLGLRVLLFVPVPLQRTVITLADRVLHTQVHFRIKLIHRCTKHHT